MGKRNILITGGAGFIGSHVVRLFVRKYPDCRIVNFDKLTYAGNLANLRDIESSPNYVFVRGDICDAAAVAAVFAEYEIDGVIHLAAESHVDRSIEDPLTFARTNVLGTLTLLQAARTAWEPGGWKLRHGDGTLASCLFHHISTDEVYGALEITHPLGISVGKRPDRDKDCSDEILASRGLKADTGRPGSDEVWVGDGPDVVSETDARNGNSKGGQVDVCSQGRIVYGDSFFREDSAYAPHSPYSAGKASSDHFVRAFHDTYGMPAIVTNCSNNYGPFQFPEKLIPLMINNVILRRPLPVYGRGENVRDWLYVEDHARAIDTVFHCGRPGRTYNIGGSCERKNIDVVRTVVLTADRLLGRGEGEDLGLISYVTDRKGHDLRYAIDSSRLRHELGWEPSVDFEEGIEKTVRWYLDNRDWLDGVTSGEYMNYYEKMYSGRTEL